MEQPTARILLVDDEAPIRMTLERLLQRRGYVVMVAASGEEALTQLAQHRFDLLLLDLRLPRISGLDIARHAQSLQPAPAILLLTGHASLEAASDTPRLETFEYMLKTSSPQDVLARVAAIIQGALNRPENRSP